MADAILTVNRTAELKKACAAVLRCCACYEKFVSHDPLIEVQMCERCLAAFESQAALDGFAIVGSAIGESSHRMK